MQETLSAATHRHVDQTVPELLLSHWWVFQQWELQWHGLFSPFLSRCVIGEPLGARRGWAIGKHRFDRMMTRPTPGELDGTNGSDLAIGKVGILGFEINDELAHGDRKRAVVILSLRFRRPEEANDAMRVKGISSSTQAPFRQARFLRPFCWWNAEKHNRPDPLIQALLGVRHHCWSR
jgi:hypothetical protein